MNILSNTTIHGTLGLPNITDLAATTTRICVVDGSDIVKYRDLADLAIDLGVITVTGSDTDIFFNDGGALGADSNFQYDKTSEHLLLTEVQTHLTSVNAAHTGWVGTPDGYGTVYSGHGEADRFYGEAWSIHTGVNSSGRPNAVGMFWGYNVNPNGGRINSNEGAFRFGTETHYEEIGGGFGDAFEFHLPEITTYSGLIYRPFSLYVSKENLRGGRIDMGVESIGAFDATFGYFGANNLGGLIHAAMSSTGTTDAVAEFQQTVYNDDTTVLLNTAKIRTDEGFTFFSNATRTFGWGLNAGYAGAGGNYPMFFDGSIDQLRLGGTVAPSFSGVTSDIKFYNPGESLLGQTTILNYASYTRDTDNSAGMTIGGVDILNIITDININNNSLYHFLRIKPQITMSSALTGVDGTNNIIEVAPLFKTAVGVTASCGDATNASMTMYYIAPTYDDWNNMTVRGVFYNPTFTNIAGTLVNIAFENTTGGNYFNSTSGDTAIGIASFTALTAKLTVGGEVVITSLDTGATAPTTTGTTKMVICDADGRLSFDNIPGGGSYTDEEAQDAVDAMLAATDTISYTYTDATPLLEFDVITQLSITSDASGIKLVGDTATPGNSYYYGTDGSGTKGYFTLPSVGVAGGDTNVQFNDGGSTFGADSGFTYNKTTDVLSTLGGYIADSSGGTGNIQAITIKGTYASGDKKSIVWKDSGGTVVGQIDTRYDGANLIDMVFGSLYSSGYNTTDRLILKGSGEVIIPSLDTGVTAPTTSGTIKMVVCDANGLLSYDNIPTGSTLADADYGDITVSGTGTVFTIDNDVVTYAKMQNASAGNVILGRVAATSGDYSELAIGASELAGRGSTGDLAAITIGTGLSMSGTTLSSSITQYTDADAIDAVGLILVDSATIDFTYTAGTPDITAIVKTNSIDETHIHADAILQQTAETTADDADLILIYDDSATALRSMTRANFLAGISGAGEANTASNLGGGLANWDSKSGVDLRFNTFSTTDFNLSSNLISIDYTNGQAASGSTKGFLTSTDWTTFNSKESALTFSTGLTRSTNTITWDGTQVRKNSTGSTFTRRRINFIEGANITLTVADDAGDDEIDVTIAGSASGLTGTTDHDLVVSGANLNTNKAPITLTSSAGASTWDRDSGFNAVLTLTEDVALTITDAVAGDFGNLQLIQDGSGGWTITVPDGTVTIDAAATAVTIVSWYYDGTTFFWRDGAGSSAPTPGYTVVTVTATTYNATQTSGDIVLLVDTTTAGGAVTINLPAVSGNTAKFTVKRITGSANITLDGNASENVEGAATATLAGGSGMESVTIINDTTAWWII